MILILYRILAALWRLIPEEVQWRLLWLLNPKMVVGVSGVILNDQREVLLLNHRFHPRHPWGLPGGWIERNECIDEAWRREVREETQLEVHVEGILLQKSTPLSLEFILLGHLIGGEMVLEANEITDARFFAADALPAGLHEDHREAIQRATRVTSTVVPLPTVEKRPLSEEPTV